MWVVILDDNKLVIRAFIDTVWTGQDLAALDRFWTDDCVNHASPADHNVGLENLTAYHQEFAEQFQAFSHVQIRIIGQVAEDDLVVTHLLTTGRHTGDFAGIPPTQKEATLTTIRIDRLVGSRIAEHWSVADIAGLLQHLQA